MANFRTLQQWLRNPASDDSAASAGLLTSLFSTLPDLSPSPRLVDDVLAEFGLVPRSRFAAVAYWSPRAALVACLLLALVTLMGLPVLAVLPIPSFAGLAAMFVGTARLAASWMVAGAEVLDFSVSIAVKTALVLSTPQALLFLGAFLSVGLAAASALHALVTQDRSSYHANSIWLSVSVDTAAAVLEVRASLADLPRVCADLRLLFEFHRSSGTV